MMLRLGRAQIDALFPFHLAFDRDGRAVEVGPSLARLCPALAPGLRVDDHLRAEDPAVPLASLRDHEGPVRLRVLDNGAALCGQVLALDAETALFLGSPRADSPADLERLGLHAADFAPHDAAPLVAELTEARRAAEDAAALKAQILADMSHEIRSQLGATLGYADLLTRARLGPEERELSLAVRAAGRALLAVVNDVLDYSKIEAGRMDLEHIDLDVHALVDGVAAQHAGEVARKGLLLVAAVRPEVPAALVGDPARLAQILVNLVGNAVKFTHAGSVILRAEAAPPAGGEVRVRFIVADTGVGIPEEARARLFQPYSQAEATISRRFGGTGLGLTISRRLALAMGGAIGFDSRVGEGTTFWVEVPLALAGDRRYPLPPEGTRAVLVDDDDTRRELLAAELTAWGLRVRAQSGTSRALAIQGTAADVIKLGPVVSVTRILASVIPALRPVPRKSSEPRGIPRVGSVRRKVLVADDDPANRRLLAGFLNALGCDSDVVEDGVAAVEATLRGGYAAVLLDWQMPRIDGLAAAREIRFQEASRGLRTPLIAVTASAMPGDRERCLAAGIDEYLSKPIQLGELDRVLCRFLEGGAAEPQPEVVDPQVLADLRRVTRSGALLLDELIDVYVAEGHRRLASLSAALARGDLRLAGRDAHALKGSSANLGVARVRALAAAVEQQAAAGRSEGLGEAAAKLAAAFEAAAARLAAERSPAR